MAKKTAEVAAAINPQKRCPGCGRCLECGGPQVVPMPYPVPYPQPVAPYRPWVNPAYPGTNSYPYRPMWSGTITMNSNGGNYAH